MVELGVGRIFVNKSLLPGMPFTIFFFWLTPTHPPSRILCLHLQGSPSESKHLSPALPQHPVHTSVVAFTHCFVFTCLLYVCLRVFLPQQPVAVKCMSSECCAEGEELEGMGEEPGGPQEGSH